MVWLFFQNMYGVIFKQSNVEEARHALNKGVFDPPAVSIHFKCLKYYMENFDSTKIEFYQTPDNPNCSIARRIERLQNITRGMYLTIKRNWQWRGNSDWGRLIGTGIVIFLSNSLWTFYINSLIATYILLSLPWNFQKYFASCIYSLQ